MNPSMPPPRFQLVFTGPVLESIDRWSAWAETNGLGDEFSKARATLRFRLAYEADEWATRENKRDMTGPVTEIRNGIVMMLAVRYGIAPAHGIVFVTGLRWRDDYPGGRPPA